MSTQLAAAALEPHHITTFLLSLAILLGLARLLGEIAARYRQPMVLGEILAGVILGPTILGALSPDLFTSLFPEHGLMMVRDVLGENMLSAPHPVNHPAMIGQEALFVLSATLLLFVVGMDVDLSTVWRQGKAALFVSTAGIVIPFGLGFTLANLLPNTLGIADNASMLAFTIFVGISLSITALPVIAKILMDLNLAKSDMGTLVISSAMLNDLVGWIGFAIVLALMGTGAAVAGEAAGQAVAVAAQGAVQGTSASGGGGGGVALTIVITLVFLVAMLTIGRWIAHRTLPWVQAHWTWPGGVLVFVFVIGLACAAFTEWLGIHSIFGAFIAGVAIGDSHHLRERTRETIHEFITNFFSPLFFASIGLRINFVDEFDLVTVLIVLVVATMGKVFGCYFGAKAAKMSNRESWAIGFGMAAQGAVGIILGGLALDAGLIQEKLMVAIVIMALGTSLLSGPAMQKILRQKQRRNLKDFLSDRQILINPNAYNATAMIREMAAAAAEITGLDSNMIAESTLDRERIMHTGLPNGLAVPHARLEDLSRPCVILARSSGGVDFDAPDGQLARVICLLLTPTDQPESQIELLDLFARTFSDDDTRTRVLNVQTPTELLAVLNLAVSREQTPLHHDDQTLGV